MRHLIFSKNKDLPSTRALIDQLSLRGEVIVHDPHACSYPFDLEVDWVWPRATGIHYQDRDLIYLESLESRGVKSINSLRAVVKTRDKLTQLLWSKQLGLKLLPSLVIDKQLSDDELEHLIKQNHFYQFTCDEFLLKPLRSNKGLGLRYVKSLRALGDQLRYQQLVGDTDFIIQPFIQNHQVCRFFLINDLCFGLHHIPEQGHTSHLHGLKVTKKVDEDELSSFSELHLMILKYLKADYLAVEWILADGQWYFLEANTMPGFQEIDLFYQHSTAKILVEKLLGTDTNRRAF